MKLTKYERIETIRFMGVEELDNDKIKLGIMGTLKNRELTFVRVLCFKINDKHIKDLYSQPFVRELLKAVAKVINIQVYAGEEIEITNKEKVVTKIYEMIKGKENE